LKRLSSTYLAWLIPVVLAAIGAFIWNVPCWVFGEISLLLWLTTVPGALLLSARRWDLRALERVTIGTALGFGITPLVFIILRSFGAWEYSAHVVSGLNAILFLAARRGRGDKEEIASIWPVVGVVSIATLLVIAYNFTGLYFDAAGNLVTRGLFGIDIPFLVGTLPTIQNTGYFADAHQAGLSYSYHDFTYIVCAIIGDLPPNDNLHLLAHAFPLFGFAIAAIGIYSVMLRLLYNEKQGLLATIAILLLSSTWGDHVLTGALSPSYLVGIISLCAILLQVIRIRRKQTVLDSTLLFVLLVILLKNKLPVFLVMAGTVGIISLMLFRVDTRRAFAYFIPLFFAVPLIFVFGGKPNPFQPMDDFVIGAPLLGYANQIATFANVNVEDIDPVIKQLEFETEDLLIIPYTVIHLFRMTLLDGRLLLLLLAWIILRQRIDKGHLNLIYLGAAAAFVGLMLPILYSPAWYPLAVSFYTPELGAFIAGMAAIAVVLNSWHLIESRAAKLLFAVTAVYGLAGFVLNTMKTLSEERSWFDLYHIEALRWIQRNSPENSVIATHRTDHDLADREDDESFYLYSAIAERSVISAGAKYGSLLAAVADTDTTKGLHPVRAAQLEWQVRRNDQRVIFGSDDAEAIRSTMKKYNAQYLLSTHQHPVKRSDLFEPVYRSEEIAVLKLR
jgi:hypothetical protein